MKTILGSSVDEAVSLLKSGDIVAIPTETVYGLAANGLNEKAVLKIFEAKQRPLSNPLILHFATIDALIPFIKEIPAQLKDLASRFWPGPLTLLLEKTDKVPNLITANQARVAVRIPSHPLLHQLLTKIDFPLAAPSANSYGMISPTKSSHVFNQLDGKIPYILEGGECENGLESTIVGVENEKVIVYRLGSLSLEKIAGVIGYFPDLKTHTENQPLTSGMVKHHYAPNTPFSFLTNDFKYDPSLNYGFILLSDSFPEIPNSNKFILSQTENLEEAAKKLYDAMHQMDERKFDKLFIQRFDEIGLGLSMNDRLTRATQKFEED